MAKAIVKYNGYHCQILRVWDNVYFDLETLEKTKLGIIEQYLSVHVSELRAQGNVLRLCVCLPLAQCFNLPQMLMGQIAQNRCYTLARLIKR